MHGAGKEKEGYQGPLIPQQAVVSTAVFMLSVKIMISLDNRILKDFAHLSSDNPEALKSDS